MGFVNWRQVLQNRDERRRATREVLILLGEWGHTKEQGGGRILYLLSYLLTYLLIPWNRVLLEQLTGSQLVKKFTAFYGT